MIQCTESRINVSMNGDSHRGYNVWRLIQGVQYLEPHIAGIMYGVSYRGHYVLILIRKYTVWRLIERAQSMKNHIESTLYGDAYSGYNVWRLIYA